MNLFSSSGRRGAWLRGVAITASFGFVGAALAGCGTQGATDPDASSAPTDEFVFDEARVKAAEESALEATGGKADLGGTVDFVWGTGGKDNERFKAMVKPFTDATGIKVNVESVSNTGQILQTRLAAGNPPDVASDTGAGAVLSYLSSGKLQPIEGLIEPDTFKKTFGEGQYDALTVDGHTYGIPAATQTMLVWYNKKLYKGPTENVTWPKLVEWAKGEIMNGGVTPFCTNLEQGAASGVIATVQLDNIVAQELGPEYSKGLAEGTIKYTDPKFEELFTDYVDLFQEDGMIYGGAQGALTTPINDTPQLMFTDPQSCQITHWGSFVPGIIQQAHPDLEAKTDFDYFPLVPSDGSTPTVYQWGWQAFSFSDSPQTQAFMKYWGSDGFQGLIASSGAYVVAHRNVPLDAYPNPILRDVAQTMLEGEPRMGPYGIQPFGVRTQMFGTIVGSIADPSKIHSLLEAMDTTYEEFLDAGGFKGSGGR
jgi:alpha-glucoside transport system substrate-binding protein